MPAHAWPYCVLEATTAKGAFVRLYLADAPLTTACEASGTAARSRARGAGEASLRTVAKTAAITSTAPMIDEASRLSPSSTAPSSTATAGFTYWWLTTVEIGRLRSAQT